MDEISPDLANIWERLGEVTAFEFQAESRSGTTGWQGNGTGTVRVDHQGPNVLVFEEQGSWAQTSGLEMGLRNTYRWTRDLQQELIQLEHLRFGPSRPVYLFALQLTGGNEWTSIQPHLCREDCYSATLLLSAGSLKLAWRILGPEKDERILYRYRR